MAPLPVGRTESIKPFYTIGIDYAGPFELKVGRRIARKKVSVLVFTCLTTRAVHFEVTDGQDTSAVLNALSRFCSLRGVPNEIVSDNQSSFVKADKDLAAWINSIDFDWLEEHTRKGYLGSEGIKWTKNPPYAPHLVILSQWSSQ